MKSRMLGCKPFTTVFNFNLWLHSALLIENTRGENVGSQIRNTKQKRPHETLLLVIRNRKSKNLIGTFAPPPGSEDVGRHNEMLVNKFRLGLELLTLGLWPCGKQFTGQSPQQLNIHPYGSSCPSKARVGKINIYTIFRLKKRKNKIFLVTGLKQADLFVFLWAAKLSENGCRYHYWALTRSDTSQWRSSFGSVLPYMLIYETSLHNFSLVSPPS